MRAQHAAVPLPGRDFTVMLMATTEAERRLAFEQSLANTSIEGHIPTDEFLADCEAVIRGEMTPAEKRARSIARALAADQAVSGKV